MIRLDWLSKGKDHMKAQRKSQRSFFRFATHTALRTGKVMGEIGLNLLKNHPKTSPHIDRLEELVEDQKERVNRLIYDFENQFWQWIQDLDSESKRILFPPSQLELQKAYQLLDVDSSASFHEIKRAWKKKMMQYHPDRVAQKSPSFQKESEIKAQEINLAYQCLKRHFGQ